MKDFKEARRESPIAELRGGARIWPGQDLGDTKLCSSAPQMTFGAPVPPMAFWQLKWQRASMEATSAWRPRHSGCLMTRLKVGSLWLHEEIRGKKFWRSISWLWLSYSTHSSSRPFSKAYQQCDSANILKVFKVQFPHLFNGDNYTYLIGLVCDC